MCFIDICFELHCMYIQLYEYSLITIEKTDESFLLFFRSHFVTIIHPILRAVSLFLHIFLCEERACPCEHQDTRNRAEASPVSCPFSHLCSFFLVLHVSLNGPRKKRDCSYSMYSVVLCLLIMASGKGFVARNVWLAFIK